MSPTDKVLGQLGAIQTFLDNFPMSLLDSIHGKTYTSVFEFIIDVLNACGVNTNQIVNTLLKAIYGAEVGIENDAKWLYEAIKNGMVEIDKNEQSEFLKGMEAAIKAILMALFVSIFTCSALPIIPARVLDPNNESHGGESLIKNDSLKNYIASLNDPRRFDIDGLKIPKSLIDPFNMLDISPTSSDGLAYYTVGGKNVYYKKQTVTVVDYEEVEVKDAMGLTEYKTVLKYDEDKNIPIKTEYSGGKLFFNITKPISKDFKIEVYYTAANSAIKIMRFKIVEGKNSSQKIDFNSSFKIKEISINGKQEGDIDGYWLYLSSDISDATKKIFRDSVPFGKKNEEKEIRPVIITDSGAKKITTKVVKREGKYVELSDEEKSKAYKTAKKMNYVPEVAGETDPEYISCYSGANPNMLYRTNDMNAFIWYALNKGMVVPQIERNHLMWDNRLAASKKGVERASDKEWNDWYNSKKYIGSEFSSVTFGETIKPVIQLLPFGSANNMLNIKLPSQVYCFPNRRKKLIMKETDSNVEVPKHGFNASVYKFDSDYLDSIEILHPKIMIIKMIEYLTGFAIDQIHSLDFNITKKIVEAKVQSAIKKIIETNDMETEDCYMEFSNDEFNEMLEEMQLQRYKATPYGGDTNVIKTHDITEYISDINGINSNATQAGTVTQVTKMLTQVTAEPTNGEPTIDYGVNVGYDKNILKKLLWATVMPIVEMLLTPQILLLIYINFDLLGVTKMDNFMSQDLSKIINLLLNKILGLIKSIILYIKDWIISLLLKLFFEVILPWLIKKNLLLFLERLEYWLTVLKAALSCLITFKFPRRKIISAIGDVNYADILEDNNQLIPETGSSC